MAKYELFKEGRVFTEMDKLLCFQAIANELAEANRLKRIEINAMYIFHKDGMTKDGASWEWDNDQLEKMLEGKE